MSLSSNINSEDEHHFVMKKLEKSLSIFVTIQDELNQIENKTDDIIKKQHSELENLKQYSDSLEQMINLKIKPINKMLTSTPFTSTSSNNG